MFSFIQSYLTTACKVALRAIPEINLFFPTFEPFPKIYKLFIVGPKGAGKTTLWNLILGRSGKPESTSRERIKSTTIHQNGRKCTFLESIDYGGGDDWVNSWREDLLNNLDAHVLFLFDASRVFREDEAYIKAIKQRLYVILNIQQRCQSKHHLILLGTHLDKINKSEIDKAKQQIWQEILIQYIKDLGLTSDKNLGLINLTDQAQSKAFLDRLF